MFSTEGSFINDLKYVQCTYIGRRKNRTQKKSAEKSVNINMNTICIHNNIIYCIITYKL